MNWDSFFDDQTDEDVPYSIWKRVNSPEDTIDMDNQPILYEGYFLKSESNSDSLKERYFVLTPTHLLYRKVCLDIY